MSDQAPPGLYQPAAGQPPQGGDSQSPGGPDDPYNPAPHAKRHWARNTALGVLGVLGIVVVIVAATSGGGGAAAPSATPSGTRGTAHALGRAPAGQARGIGTSFAAKDASGGTYRVRLDLIVDPAQAADRSASPGHGLRFVGVVLTLKAAGGSLRIQNVRHDAVVVGSNGQTYRPVVTPVAGYTGFRQGPIAIARGASATGAVTFDLPAGVTVSTVRWSAAPGSGSMITWPVR